jgi:hypothetical protein
LLAQSVTPKESLTAWIPSERNGVKYPDSLSPRPGFNPTLRKRDSRDTYFGTSAKTLGKTGEPVGAAFLDA